MSDGIWGPVGPPPEISEGEARARKASANAMGIDMAPLLGTADIPMLPPDPLARIAGALESIAASLAKLAETPERDRPITIRDLLRKYGAA